MKSGALPSASAKQLAAQVLSLQHELHELQAASAHEAQMYQHAAQSEDVRTLRQLNARLQVGTVFS